MISIDLGTIEQFDSSRNEFIYKHGGVVRFEYTLKVVYDWESKWKKPFLKGDLTQEETVDFYMMMALDDIEEDFMTENVMSILYDYIRDEQTATTFSTPKESQNGNNVTNKAKVYTAEELYATMFSANIPLEFENRNLNRLMVILRIISAQNNPDKKKMSRQDIYKQNASLNAQRKAMLKTKG